MYIHHLGRLFMATSTPVNNIWRYQINLKRAGQVAMIGYTLRNVGTPANTDYFNFCNSILTGNEGVGSVFSLTKELLVSEWVIQSHQIQAISPVRLVPLIRIPGGTPIPGIRDGVALPINTQVAVDRKTAVATRKGRSILHPPFGSTDDTTDKANWDAGFLIAVQSWANKTISNMVGSTSGDVLQPVIWSSGAPADALEFRIATIGDTLRTMRRRTVGVGK